MGRPAPSSGATRRRGAELGHLRYNSRYDLEPTSPKKGDGDIDGKDVQTVWGRHDSVCSHSGLEVDGTHPPQVPVDPKAKIEPPLNNDR